MWWFGVPLFAAFMIPISAVDIGPAYAARAGGTPGVFTATEVDCGGKGGCFYTGEFRSDDGRVTRTDVGMATGSSVNAVGDSVRAVDTGDRNNVYPPGGGSDWLIITAFLLGGIGLAVTWTVTVVRRVRRRH